MNKAKFTKKCLEVRKNEEAILQYAKSYFLIETEKLKKIGLALDIRLEFWMNGNIDDGTPDRIEFKEGYMCGLVFQIRRKSDPEFGLDTELIYFNFLISYILRTFFLYRLKVGCFPLKKVESDFQEVKKYVNKVMKEGYDTVLSQLREEELNK